MTLSLAVLVALTFALVCLTAFGPRRWYRYVAVAVRPGAPEPSDVATGS